jgi:thiol:disulfide interchange protein DsbC
VYWVLLPNNETLMMSADGVYLLGKGVNKITGGSVEMVNGKLIEQHIRKTQQAVIGAFDSNREQQIIYPSQGEKKSEIYVFTDVNCGYCRKFHRDVPELNAAGIEVHYFAGPFFSKDRESLEQIWCAKDPLVAMTQVKQGQKLKGIVVTEQCKQIVSDHIALGQSLGIRGTPAIYTKDGVQIGGYVEPKNLIEILTNK